MEKNCILHNLPLELSTFFKCMCVCVPLYLWELIRMLFQLPIYLGYDVFDSINSFLADGNAIKWKWKTIVVNTSTEHWSNNHLNRRRKKQQYVSNCWKKTETFSHFYWVEEKHLNVWIGFEFEYTYSKCVTANIYMKANIFRSFLSIPNEAMNTFFFILSYGLFNVFFIIFHFQLRHSELNVQNGLIFFFVKLL